MLNNYDKIMRYILKIKKIRGLNKTPYLTIVKLGLTQLF